MLAHIHLLPYFNTALCILGGLSLSCALATFVADRVLQFYFCKPAPLQSSRRENRSRDAARATATVETSARSAGVEQAKHA